MKRFLPFFILGLGIIIFVIAFIFIKKSFQAPPENTGNQEETVADLLVDQSPVTSLTPSSDGHWLKLKIEGIKVQAKSMDYELLYSLPDGRTQGVPGTVDLSGKDSIERDLLLGSESSGKFRYDQGVKKGTLNLKFRDSGGKLIGKLSTDFALLSDTTDLSSVDGSFKFTLNKDDGKTFYVIMKTFALPAPAPSTVSSGPFGIFVSSSTSHTGKVTISGQKVYEWNGGSWELVDTSSSVEAGIFLSTN